VYLFLLSLLPLWPAVATLRSALDFRHRLELGNRPPGSAHRVAENALVTAIVGLIFAIIPTLQQLTKVLRLRGERSWLVGRGCVNTNEGRRSHSDSPFPGARSHDTVFVGRVGRVRFLCVVQHHDQRLLRPGRGRRVLVWPHHDHDSLRSTTAAHRRSVRHR
jgi:hypothetical protein